MKQAINMHHTGKAKVCVFIKVKTARRMKVLAMRRGLPGVSELVERMVERESDAPDAASPMDDSLQERLDSIRKKYAVGGGV